MKKFILFAFALPFFYAPLHAAAQDADLPELQTYDPTFTGRRNEAADFIREQQRMSLRDKGFIAPTSIQVSIVHLPYMEDGQFGLQMAVPDVVSGCYGLTPLEYEAKFVNPGYLDIKVKKYRRVAPENTAVQKCDQGNKMSTALMPLDRKDLMARGVKEIRFMTESATDNYRLIIDDTHVELVPRSMMMFKAQNLSGPLKDRIIYSFQSDQMIALQVPMAQPGEDLTPQIVKFAHSRALTPATPDQIAAWGRNGLATYYFYDQSGGIRSLLNEDGYAEVGTLTTNRPYDGEQGRTETGVELSIFATRPGTQL